MATPTLPPQTHIIKPKLGGFLFSYILFSLPGFIVGIIWLLVSIVFLIGAMAGFGSSGSASGIDQSLEIATYREGKSKEGVLIYELNGPITSGNLSESSNQVEINTTKVAQDFKKIKEDPNIKNIVFKVNTPGGELYASEILGDLILDLQNSKSKTTPIFYFDQLSASGGLWSSYKTGGYVFGSPYGETGSIGVFMSLPNYKGIADKIGYSETVIKSSSAKDLGNPFREITKEEKEYLQKRLDEYTARFKAIVANGRKMDLAKVEELATGLTFPNKEALQKGLVDEVGDIEKAIFKAASEGQLSADYTVYKTERKPGIFSQLFQGKTFQNLLGLPQIDANFKLQPGHAYAIDETKI
jgi:protease IV